MSLLTTIVKGADAGKMSVSAFFLFGDEVFLLRSLPSSSTFVTQRSLPSSKFPFFSTFVPLRRDSVIDFSQKIVKI